MTTTSTRPLTLYFGYGSNLWLDQMKRRCPESKFIGTASLVDWKWTIVTPGYANVIQSPGDIVYGLVYELSPADEACLDVYENVPLNYVKRILAVEFVGSEGYGSLKDGRQFVEALVYVDEIRVTEGPPKKEYIYRMNMAIADAIKEGVPEAYFKKYVRRFIPAEGDEGGEP